MLTQKQINIICEEIKKDKRVQSIMLTGSYVYGKPNDNSDLDIRMITSDGSSWAEWDSWKFGVRIEAFYNTPDIVRNYFEAARKKIDSPSVIHFWANGKIVYDPNGIAAQLQDEAKKLWKLGPYEGKWEKREQNKHE